MGARLAVLPVLGRLSSVRETAFVLISLFPFFQALVYVDFTIDGPTKVPVDALDDRLGRVGHEREGDRGVLEGSVAPLGRHRVSFGAVGVKITEI